MKYLSKFCKVHRGAAADLGLQVGNENLIMRVMIAQLCFGRSQYFS